MGSILYITDVPPDGGGDTAFANMYLAYETLSARMKAHIEGLSAIHDGGHVYTQPTYDARQDKQLPHAEHPIVRTHPVTGRKALFVDRGFTTRIVGLPADEGAAILEYLLRHLETARVPVPFSLGSRLDCAVGQSLRAASGDIRLPPASPLRTPRHDPRR